MSISRRKFLAGTAAAAVVASTTSVPRLWAAANHRSAHFNDQRILVVIQLSGGNDGLNTVMPYADDVYHRNRFATRIAADRVIKIDDYVGFHPALGGFGEMVRENRLAVIPGVGYPNPNRSHFESMDIWHSAHFTPPHRTGWLGRWIDEQAAKDRQTNEVNATAQALRALHIGDEPLPLALTGLNALVPSLKTIDSLRVASDELVQAALKMESVGAAPADLLDFLQGARSTALTAADRLKSIDVRQLQRTGDYDQSGLSRKLAAVAQLIKIGFGPRVYYVELAGFDTHSQQPDAHAALLGELGRAVRAFHRDLDGTAQAENVLTFCFSEFGRRVKENGSRGTDHGTAAPVMIVGPKELPKMSGKYPSLTDLDDGDLKFTVDFRSVYSTILQKWLGVDSASILGDKHPMLDFLG
ncbi:MAG: DUF1501 domain-containing protein [Pirellulaceae bacterium]